MKKSNWKLVLLMTLVVVLALMIDYQIWGVDSPVAYVVFYVIGVHRPGPLPLFCAPGAGSAGCANPPRLRYGLVSEWLRRGRIGCPLELRRRGGLEL
jgi:hypothetical protein